MINLWDCLATLLEIFSTAEMAKDETDDLLPDKDAAKGFYAKYEPKEILGRSVLRQGQNLMQKYNIFN